MTDAVNGKPRRYDSTRRVEQAKQNRLAVLEAARRRFLDEGYAAATLTEIAADAGVSVETVYKAFSNKGGLLKALFDVSVAGDDEPTAMVDRDVIRRIANEPDPVKKIRGYTAHLATSMPSAGPVQLLARDAAAADPGAAAVWAATQSERLAAMTMFARNLAETGKLRVQAAKARDVLWTYHAPELYELLVLERGWSAQRYGRFLADALIAALL